MATQKRPKNEAKTYSDQWKQIVAPKTLNTSNPIPFPLFANWSGFVFIVACRLTIDTLINDVADTRHSTPNANFV